MCERGEKGCVVEGIERGKGSVLRVWLRRGREGESKTKEEEVKEKIKEG